MTNSVSKHRDGDGYWIAPSGHVLRLVTTHIAAICQRPEAFGIDPEELQMLFADYGEPWAIEGHAREAVIVELVRDGAWIRVRHYAHKNAYWSFNLPALAPEHLNTIGAFFRSLGTRVFPEDSVRLDAPKGREWSTIGGMLAAERAGDIELAWVGNVAALPKATSKITLPSPRHGFVGVKDASRQQPGLESDP